MSTGYQIYDQGGCYYLTFQVVGWVDLFSRKNYRDIFTETLRFSIANKGLRVHAYVIMSNHIHLILSAADGNLSDLVRGIKSWTAQQFWAQMQKPSESRREWMSSVFQEAATQHSRNSTYQIWTHENHAVELHTDAFIKTRVDYIHNNPVRAGLVREPSHYRYSSAADYFASVQVGEVPITFLL